MNDRLHKGQTCRGCGAPVVWKKTRSGKPMICEAKAIKVAVDIGDGTVSIVTGHEPHWANCPKADSFRRPR